jgi:PAS domain S-box-containing protein
VDAAGGELMKDANFPTPENPETLRAAAIFQEQCQTIVCQTDRLLMWLMIFQWIAGVLAAICISPKAWIGMSSHLHPHVWAALFYGGVIASLPVSLAAIRPGLPITRHALAAGQMLMSALLIHISGGRIETHFHIFGSLAFLSFYRDWRVLITASIVVAADHFAGGMLWPESMYGVLSAPIWRSFEHAGWVIFEDVCLIIFIRQSVREMRNTAERQAELESSNSRIEQTVAQRTAELMSEIAERRQAEQSMQSSERRFRQLAETIQDVFWMTSSDCREVLYLSPGYEQIWGRSCASVHEHPETWFDTIVPEDRASVMTGMNKGAQGETFEMKFRITRPDGAVRSIFSRGFPVHDEAGNLQSVVGLSSDVTERQRMEEKLFEAGKLETVGRLAGGIAHDFNTILTSIIGHSELIAQAVPEDGPVFHSADQIARSATRAAQLTHQLLAFSRKQMLQPENLDLNTTITEAELTLRRLLGDGIEVCVAIHAKSPWAKADAGQIQQMLVQLALNAKDAMPRGGRLTLETGDITLDETYASTRPQVAAGDYVMIAISDTGDGIPDEVKPHLFEPFFTTKPQGEGTGLGLAMCYGIVRQIGGYISVYSELGHGTTFKIFLPRVLAQPSEPAAAIAPALKESPARGTETILLVEDDDDLRDLAGIVLKRLGYNLHSASNGIEAISIAENHAEIDLLLTDVVMPQMRGKELADRLGASHPSMKVLFTSAYTENAIIHHGILDPGIDFLHKPYTPALLSRKTRAALDGA